MHVYKNACMYISMCACMYVCLYVSIYILEYYQYVFDIIYLYARVITCSTFIIRYTSVCYACMCKCINMICTHVKFHMQV